ncbi:DUF3592 domain-containing protein [Roseomonas eburnea]|uniref:DUF3592 domain-containing protein n=1 Tax=Neoroseomonas eburnea TaxID=1346889 RepID=A0A9X9X5J5_9PROT|nr:DUF3592 domain-containing protein [Neoroseomonas eburnea]MBR0678981.1 DUF3592 domain-containing protein [Neoroseomonas eburnea]
MQVTYRTTTVSHGGRMTRIVSWILLLVGFGLLAGSGFAAWSEIQFRRVAVETDGRVVQMLTRSSRDRDGRSSRTYTPVFAFNLPNGKEVRAEGSVASNPPCCTVGEAVRVRYDPARPERAAMAGFMESWFVATLLGGMGAIFAGFGVLTMRVFGRRGVAAAAVAALPSFAVPLAGLRRELTREGPRWYVQARWQDPRSGVARLFESAPLPFDPVPQMRQMTAVQVQFDPSQPDGPYWMDLSFLAPPAPGADATMAAGPVRRG